VDGAVTLNIDLIVLHIFGIYLYECSYATLERGCTEAGGQIVWSRGLTAKGGDVRETLILWTPHSGETPDGPSTHLLTPPAVETLATASVETGPKFQKHQSGQTLRENIYELGGHQYVQDADITDVNAFPDEVEVDLDMLCALVLNRVGGEVDGAEVVAVDESALRQRSMELLEELPEDQETRLSPRNTA
jgi:hypothetical protein